MKYLLFVFFLVFQIKAFCQVNSISFRETCDFISTDQNGILYFGTPSGLYKKVGDFPLEKLKLTGLDNKNIQSPVFWQNVHRMWFCTYNRVVSYDPNHGVSGTYQIESKTLGKLNSDYYIFEIDTINNLLWVKQNLSIYLFDLKTNSFEFLCDSVEGRRIFKMDDVNGNVKLFSYYYTFKPLIVSIDKKNNQIIYKQEWLNWPANCKAMDIVLVDSNTLLIGTNQGLLIGDLTTRLVRMAFQQPKQDGVRAIGKISTDSWLVSFKNSGIKLVKGDSHGFSIENLPYEGIHDNIQRIITNSEGEIFLSSYENRIIYFHPGKIKFKNFKQDNLTLSGIYYQNKFILKYIAENEVTSGGSPYSFTSDYEVSSKYPFHATILIKDNKISTINHPDNSTLYRYFTFNNQIFGSFINNGVYKFVNNNWQPILFPDNNKNECNYIYSHDSIYFASLNQEKIIVWNLNSRKLIKEFIYSGDVYNQYLTKDNRYLYLATDRGIARYKFADSSLELFDSIQTPCLCLLADKYENLWFSSADGIYKFDSSNDKFKLFSYSDGVSTEKYAKRKCIAFSSDSLLFFHEKGLTFIKPSAILPIQWESKLFISDLKINDQDYFVQDTFSYCDVFEVPYNDNTLSFNVLAIDWSDPNSTNLKYKLDGYDESWVVAGSSKAFVRYANLPPKSYTFLIQGANAEGIWNSAIKKLYIIVNPPFWLTWWFITLVSSSIAALTYWGIRSYYQRKLEKKNQLLREQSLIIEKQQAVEHERTRIASEMHDDLGSGLTTIRYLSDKALTQAKDAEEAIQIKKIADHSNALVRNMSEIIWAMNSRFDTAENLVGYLRRYASEFLDEHGITLKFNVENDHLDEINVGGEKRRNIFLVFKEVLHNTVKYSESRQVNIDISTQPKIKIRVSEIGGKGFDPVLSTDKGNGLYNCSKRMNSIQGQLTFERTNESMQILITAPINQPANEHH